MARSPKATVYIHLKFATTVPYERIEIFEAALREFVKCRPREWANFSGFRATQVMAELNYIGTFGNSRESTKSLLNRYLCKRKTQSGFSFRSCDRLCRGPYPCKYIEVAAVTRFRSSRCCLMFLIFVALISEKRGKM
jgi:hypothetical protein